MRLVRVSTPEGPRSGLLREDGVVRAASHADPAGGGEELGSWQDLAVLAPCSPTKVVGVGRNYADNLAEKQRARPDVPFLFLKGPNAVVGDGAPILRPAGVDRLEYEAELAVVIGRRARGLTPADWRAHVLGYTCGNDLSVRDWQTPERQWVLAKSSDALCPLGPWIETDLGDPSDLAIRASVNGVPTQDGRSADMLFGVADLLIHITRTITLEPGDVVLTGTPAGAGPLVAGDVVAVEVEGIGTLTNQVVDA